ncbi:SPOR domain-containing protein [Nitrincola nitratireducens]|uniref:Cell division protein DedD n=1 Tax=Nitrincola nitratireducens TaxID=1229521 RepID=W9URT5_9GAMM|nr:SPOR domain-containing protein [Nitrincola nitratireducens]EXJ09938.1 cell division protein DedD [Nitrincola nitratireducens]
MKDAIKYRVTGALILGVMLAALVPFAFDGAGHGERYVAPAVQIAPRPVAPEPVLQPVPDIGVQVEAQMEEAVVAAPVVIERTPPAPVQQVVSIDPPQASVSRPLESLAPTLNPVQEAPALDADQIPAAWALQLASFRQEANARELRTRLINAGHRVYIRHGDDVVRVFVGPEMQRTRLEELKVSLKNEYGLDGIIVRFSTQ